MGINSAYLKGALQEFMDAKYAGFTEFPADDDDFRSQFSVAIDSYLFGAKVVSPSTVSPTTGIINVEGCGDAFAAEFTMVKTPGTFQIDIVTGWTKMIQKCVLTPAGVYAPTYTISAVTPLSNFAPGGTISGAITSLMTTENTGKYACGVIANAIHNATLLAFITTCTYIIPGSPPVPTVGPIAFG